MKVHCYYRCVNTKKKRLCDKKPVKKDLIENKVVEETMNMRSLYLVKRKMFMEHAMRRSISVALPVLCTCLWPDRYDAWKQRVSATVGDDTEPFGGVKTATTDVERVEINKLNIDVVENREGELVFTFSMDDFIKAYNSCYWQDSEAHYLPSASERASDIYNNITRTAYETNVFTFTKNEPMCSLPTLPVALR